MSKKYISYSIICSLKKSIRLTQIPLADESLLVGLQSIDDSLDGGISQTNFLAICTLEHQIAQTLEPLDLDTVWHLVISGANIRHIQQGVQLIFLQAVIDVGFIPWADPQCRQALEVNWAGGVLEVQEQRLPNSSPLTGGSQEGQIKSLWVLQRNKWVNNSCVFTKGKSNYNFWLINYYLFNEFAQTCFGSTLVATLKCVQLDLFHLQSFVTIGSLFRLLHPFLAIFKLFIGENFTKTKLITRRVATSDNSGENSQMFFQKVERTFHFSCFKFEFDSWAKNRFPTCSLLQKLKPCFD